MWAGVETVPMVALDWTLRDVWFQGYDFGRAPSAGERGVWFFGSAGIRTLFLFSFWSVIELGWPKSIGYEELMVGGLI